MRVLRAFAPFAAANVTVTKTSINEIDINNYQVRLLTDLLTATTITLVLLPDRTKAPHFVSIDSVDVIFSRYTYDALI